MSTGWHIAAVFLGGGVGSVLRYGAGVLAGRLTAGTSAAGLPVGTLAVNLVGSLAIGVAAGLIARATGSEHAVRRAIELAVITGLLGGFTTFSAYTRESVELMAEGRVGPAAVYIGLSTGFGLLAAWLGLTLAGRGG